MKKSCCNVGCMNNQCKAINPQASKTCVGGNSFWVDSCGTTGQAAQDCAGNGCQNGACLPACPSDMVSIGSSAYCIDRYEDSVWSASTCTGVSYFASLGNFPAGYPALVSSSGLTGTVTVGGDSYTLSAPTTTLYACSKPGVLPAQNITYFQAKRACENAGKRLCSLTEQQTACGAVYPYGGTYSATACNGVDAGKGAAVATGSFPGCQGSVSGLFDMAGNVSEWTQCDAQSCFQSSGTFESPQSVLKCSYYSGEYASNDGGGQGFRCCKDR